MPLFRQSLITAATILGVLLLLWLFLPDLAGWAAYSHFFRTLTTEGGVNAWLARAVSTLLLAAVICGVRMIRSPLNIQRRRAGEGVLLGAFVAFYILMYFCTKESGPKRWVGRSLDGEIVVFEDRFHPITGDLLDPMTGQVWQEYQDQETRKLERRQREAAEAEERAIVEAELKAKKAEAEAERRFMDQNENQTVLSSAPAAGVILALNTDAAAPHGEEIHGLLTDLLAKNKKHPVCGVFKPPFYTSGLFDDVWNGDLSVLQRLHLFDCGADRLILCNAQFSAPSKTDFDGIVSVQGSISLMLVTREARAGLHVFKAAGVGADLALKQA